MRRATWVKVMLGAVALAAVVGCKSQSASAPDAKPKGHVRLLPAPAGAHDGLAPLVAQQQRASSAEGRTLVVYVGAPWCEPCQRFHAAAESGQLDGDFGDVDLFVLDADADAERLVLAGYESRFIPLLVVPGPDGRASERRMEGSVKGDAVADMTPRLKQLLGR